MFATTVLALTLSQAKTYAAIAAIAFFALALASWWIAKEIAKKVIMIIVFASLGLLVWFQRSNLTDCAAKVSDQVASAGSAECTFFGMDVTVPTRPGS